MHAPMFQPSFMPVGGYCSGAFIRNASAPETYSPESAEGTAAHWVASECLTMRADPDGGNPVANFWLGELAPNGVVIDDDVTEAVQVYVDHILALCNEYGALRSMLIEHKVHAPQINAGCWGTTDFALWLPDAARLIIRDYKHGHRETRAAGNLQLAAYAAGMIAELNINGYDDQRITVDLGIVQPRCYRTAGPVDTWVVPLSDLRGYINTLHNQCAEAEKGGTLTTGKHCRDCPGVVSCPAARQAAYRMFDYVREPFAIESMNGAELALERQFLQDGIAAARSRLDAIDGDLTARVQRGEGADTGLTLESKPGRKKWNVPAETVRAMAQQFGIDAAKQDVITPAQLVKKAPAQMKTAVTQAVDALSARPAGELQLIPVAESRTAKAFSK